MFGRTDHLEMLLSVTLSHPANERFEFNVIWHTTNKWLWEGWQMREPGGSEGLLASMLCWTQEGRTAEEIQFYLKVEGV